MKKNPPTHSLPLVLLVLLRMVWRLVSESVDTILVWLNLKHWPATGRAQWNRRQAPDPRSQAWQRLLKTSTPCPHRDVFGKSWIVSSGQSLTTHICVQCGAAMTIKQSTEIHHE